MTTLGGDHRGIADSVRRAFSDRNPAAFGALLSDDVTWGDVTTARGCRNRSDVLATFAKLVDKGLRVDITEIAAGSSGVLCGLGVEWPNGDPRADETSLYHVYLIRESRIFQICRFDDRRLAAQVAGLEA